MIEKQVFTVYDSAAKAFLDPFFEGTIEQAIRRFRSTVNHPEPSLMSQYPEDYTLFHMGSFNVETGRMLSLDAPHSLGVAVTFIDRPRTLSVNGGSEHA